jgi:hypothetical protein
LIIITKVLGEKKKSEFLSEEEIEGEKALWQTRDGSESMLIIIVYPANYLLSFSLSA